VMVESNSLLSVMELLKSGPYLSCIADAFLRVRPEQGVSVVPFQRDIWSCPSGALFHRSLRQFKPLQALVGAIEDISARVDRPRALRDAPRRSRSGGRTA